jgi:hypothetical protein
VDLVLPAEDEGELAEIDKLIANADKQPAADSPAPPSSDSDPESNSEE